jgi:type IV secretory pathway TrbL component
MSQNNLVTLIALVLATMIMFTFWRQLLLLAISVLIAVFCLGLIHIAQILHR